MLAGFEVLLAFTLMHDTRRYSDTVHIMLRTHKQISTRNSQYSNISAAVL
jgi:hypothetical protein